MKRVLRTASALVGLTLAGIVCAASGCNTINSIGPSCDRSAKTNVPVTYTEGTIENGVYMSSPWAGELLWFPSGQRYEIVHGLGEVPRFVQVWLSFDRCGTKSSTVALAAGNQAEMRSVDNDKLVLVNGSCVDYWLLVIAGTGSGEPDPPGEMSDAGMSDGGVVSTGSCL